MFKVGDKVERINHSRADAELGKCYIVSAVSKDGSKLALYETQSSSLVWRSDNFKLVEDTSKRRPHYDIIIAWANGATLQTRGPGQVRWDTVMGTPLFLETSEYRIKPDNSKELEAIKESLADAKRKVENLEIKLAALQEE